MYMKSVIVKSTISLVVSFAIYTVPYIASSGMHAPDLIAIDYCRHLVWLVIRFQPVQHCHGQYVIVLLPVLGRVQRQSVVYLRALPVVSLVL